MSCFKGRIICFLFAIFGFLPQECNSFGLSPRETKPSRYKPINEETETNDPLRRQIVSSIPFLALGLPANAAETPAEAIRLISSKTIPGLGPPDVYYPAYFVGRWKTTRIISSSDDPFFKDLENLGVKLPIQVTSESRFVPYDAGKDFQQIDDANPNNVPAVADRSFNEKSYYTALSQEIDRLYSSSKSMPSIQSINWTPTNPNVLSMDYSDGSSKEVKVTKRSSDVSNDGSNLFSSEFRRITAVPSSPSGIAGGIPSVYKSRVLTKWRQGNSNDMIEGIEILYSEAGVLGDKSTDPLQLGIGGSGAISSLYGGDSKDLADWRSTKTKILMERM
mmetsp:Transcript_15860/g.23727  ORF Transcript_15860/g.23727 Transcript_15860/m.23727 type:complete len:334 (-) Transcript_15860:49-1050(-)